MCNVNLNEMSFLYLFIHRLLGCFHIWGYGEQSCSQHRIHTSPPRHPTSLPLIDTQKGDFWIMWSDTDQQAQILSYKMKRYLRLLCSPAIARVNGSHRDHHPALNTCNKSSHSTPRYSVFARHFQLKKIWLLWAELLGTLCQQAKVLGKWLLCKD